MRLALLMGLVAVEARAERLPDFEPAPAACDRAKSVKALTACVAKNHGRPSIAFDNGLMMVVRADLPSRARLYVYVKAERDWERVHLIDVTPSMELLSITPMSTPHARAVRIDVGSTTRTSLSVDQLTHERGVMRRVMSTLCTAQDFGCRSFMTSCEAYRDGKAYYAFRAELFWHPTLDGWRLRGNRNAAQGVCAAPLAFMVD